MLLFDLTRKKIVALASSFSSILPVLLALWLRATCIGVFPRLFLVRKGHRRFVAPMPDRQKAVHKK
jgi:hypothetical protein